MILSWDSVFWLPAMQKKAPAEVSFVSEANQRFRLYLPAICLS